MNSSKPISEILEEIPDNLTNKIDEPKKRAATSDAASSVRILYHMLPQDGDDDDRCLDPLSTSKDIQKEFGIGNEAANNKLNRLVNDGILTKSEHKARGYTFASDHWWDLADMSTPREIVPDGGESCTTYSLAPTVATDGADSPTPSQAQSDDNSPDQATQLLDRSDGMPLLPLSVVVAASGVALLSSASPVVLLVSTCLVFLMASIAKMLEPPTTVFDTLTGGRLRTV